MANQEGYTSLTNREEHWIEPTKRTTVPRRILYVAADVECVKFDGPRRYLRHKRASYLLTVDGQQKSLDLFIAGDELHSEFMHYLRQSVGKKEKLTVVLHNSSITIPTLGIWDAIERCKLELKNYVLGDPPTILTCELDGRSIEIISVENYFKESFCNPADLTSDQQRARHHDGEDSPLGWTGAPIRVAAMARVLGSYISAWKNDGFGAWRSTASGLSWSAWKSRIVEKGYWVHNDERALSLERESYRGGLCLPFRIGKPIGDVTVVDLNSAYPAALATGRLPREYVSTQYDITVDGLRDLLREYVCIARVDYDTDSVLVPHYCNGSLCLASGHLTDVLAGNELASAVGKRWVRKVHAVAVYHHGNPFRDHILDVYGRKQKCHREGDVMGRSFYKLLLNSLYGRTGQLTSPWIDDTETIPLERWGSWLDLDHYSGSPKLCRALDGKVQWESWKEETWDSFPAIASCVTAAVRKKLIDTINAVGVENVHYCDTDSMHMTFGGYIALEDAGQIDSESMGKWKIEYCSDDCEYFGVKHYRAGGKYVASGIPQWGNKLGSHKYLIRGVRGLEESAYSARHGLVPIIERKAYRPPDILGVKLGPGGRVEWPRLMEW